MSFPPKILKWGVILGLFLPCVYAESLGVASNKVKPSILLKEPFSDLPLIYNYQVCKMKILSKWAVFRVLGQKN